MTLLHIFNFTFIYHSILSFLIAFLIVFFSYKLKFLTFSGSVATFFLAGIIFNLGEIKWSVPILTFFILSSLLSKARKKKNEKVEMFFEKSGTRDYAQVLANGGIGGVLVVINFLTHNDLYYLLYISSLSAVCADTWATELGTWKKTETYNILTFKKVEQGVSGGISLIGSFGALLGTIVIALSGLYWININYFQYFIIIISSGFIGSLIDSILGATVQLQNECNVCKKITERNYHCDLTTKYYKGFNWIDNDMVNFIVSLAAPLVIIIFQNI